jgi:hypothetical protein
MNNTTRNQSSEVNNERNDRLGSARVVVLALVSFVTGLTVSAFWFSRQAPVQAVLQAAPPVAVQESVVQAPSVHVPIAPASHLHVVDAATLEAVKRALPNPDKTTEEMGTVILRKAAVVEFETAARSFSEERKKIEEELRQLPEKEQKVAAKRLLDTQSEQAAKLKQIAANSKAEIEAFHELKAAAQ